MRLLALSSLCVPGHTPLPLRRVLATGLLLLPLLSGCRGNGFPDVAPGYREFAYVSGGTNSVAVLDLVRLRPVRTLTVGEQPTGLAANPVRSEIYAVNTGSDSVSVIDAERNEVVATIPVRRRPFFISVSSDGRRAYVADSGSDQVSVLDLATRREVSVAQTGAQPGMARVSPDGRSVVVSNRASGSVSVYAADPTPGASAALRLRATFSGCAGPTDIAILPDSSKAFVACSGAHDVLAISLAAAPGSWAARQNGSLLRDHMLALLEVGPTPIHLALKPDGGEIFVSNFDGDSVSEIATQTNEVGGTYTIASRPAHALVSADNSTLWVSNFGADSLSLYSIDDGRLAGAVRTGSSPDALAFSADEHLLLAADAGSGDVSVIRTAGRGGPALFTILPAVSHPNSIAVKALGELNPRRGETP